MNNYCVYVYLRSDNTPYYVGMGRPERPFAKHAHRKDKGDFKPNSNDKIKILHSNLTIEKAFELEIEYIALYKRKCDGGTLINLTIGGEGAKHNEETKEKLRNYRLGSVHSEETKKKMSFSRKNKKRNPESTLKSWNTKKKNGYKVSDETKQKLSLSHKGLLTGEKNPAARAILAFSLKGDFLGEFSTAREAALKLNLGNCWKHIPAVCKGRRKHTKKIIFKYKSD